MASTGKSSFVGDLFKDVKASVKGSIGNFIGQKAQGTPLEGLISKFTEKGTPGAVGGKGMDGPINKFTAAVNTFTKAVDGKGSSGGDVSTLGLAKKEEIVENASAIDKLTASMDSATESAKIFKETSDEMSGEKDGKSGIKGVITSIQDWLGHNEKLEKSNKMLEKVQGLLGKSVKKNAVEAATETAASTAKQVAANTTATVSAGGKAVAGATANSMMIPFPFNIAALGAGIAAVVGALAMIKGGGGAPAPPAPSAPPSPAPPPPETTEAAKKVEEEKDEKQDVPKTDEATDSVVTIDPSQTIPVKLEGGEPPTAIEPAPEKKEPEIPQAPEAKPEAKKEGASEPEKKEEGAGLGKVLKSAIESSPIGTMVSGVKGFFEKKKDENGEEKPSKFQLLTTKVLDKISKNTESKKKEPEAAPETTPATPTPASATQPASEEPKKEGTTPEKKEEKGGEKKGGLLSKISGILGLDTSPLKAMKEKFDGIKSLFSFGKKKEEPAEGKKEEKKEEKPSAEKKSEPEAKKDEPKPETAPESKPEEKKPEEKKDDKGGEKKGGLLSKISGILGLDTSPLKAIKEKFDGFKSMFSFGKKKDSAPEAKKDSKKGEDKKEDKKDDAASGVAAVAPTVPALSGEGGGTQQLLQKISDDVSDIKKNGAGKAKGAGASGFFASIGDKIKDLTNKAKEKVSGLAEKAKDKLQAGVSKAKDLGKSAVDKGKDLAGKAKEKLQAGASKAKEIGSNAIDKGKELAGKGVQAAKKAGGAVAAKGKELIDTGKQKALELEAKARQKLEDLKNKFSKANLQRAAEEKMQNLQKMAQEKMAFLQSKAQHVAAMAMLAKEQTKKAAAFVKDKFRHLQKLKFSKAQRAASNLKCLTTLKNNAKEMASNAAAHAKEAAMAMKNIVMKGAQAAAGAVKGAMMMPFPLNLVALAGGAAAVIGGIALAKALMSGGGGEAPSGGGESAAGGGEEKENDIGGISPEDAKKAGERKDKDAAKASKEEKKTQQFFMQGTIMAIKLLSKIEQNTRHQQSGGKGSFWDRFKNKGQQDNGGGGDKPEGSKSTDVKDSFSTVRYASNRTRNG